QLGKFLRAPFARQRGVAHLNSSATLKFSDREAARTSSCLRHPTSPLPLLPSGPDGIHDWSSRRSRCEPPSSIGESGLRPFRGHHASKRRGFCSLSILAERRLRPFWRRGWES